MSVKQTFWQLLDKYQIEIPIIQRDYAQGRNDSKAKQIREGFVKSLHSVVTDTNNSQDLDFIYGSVHNDTLTLLDGQQRLTTLFLLHWYIAAGCGCLANAEVKLQRFSYKTRVSSREFVDSLLLFGSEIDILNCEDTLSSAIIDSHWFFSVWRNDPTVQSMLTMLDEIHRVFIYELAGGKALWELLTSETNPPITFHFLEMKEFSLTDELYIKMNARGRPLTEFENFKAWLQSYVEERTDLQLTEGFWALMDKEWTDVFWKLRDSGEYEIDNLFLSCFKSVAQLNSALLLKPSQGNLESLDNVWLLACRDNAFIPTQAYKERHCFEGQTLNKIGMLLSLCHQLQLAPADSKLAKVWQQCHSIFVGVLRDRSLQNQARFSALYLFVQKVFEQDLVESSWSDELIDELSDWLSVTMRLSVNITYDITMNYVSSSHALNRIIESVEVTNVLASIATLDSSEWRFFNENQRSEEILKASLIVQDNAWRERFAKYENHRYFYHQIGFLLLGAKQEDGSYDADRFEELARKAAVLFEDYLETPDFLMQRALLTTGLYLVKPSHRNHSFCRNITGNARARYENWRRVFNNESLCAILFELLDKLKTGEEEQGMRAIIDNANCQDWRKYVNQYPKIISYSSERQIRLGGDEIYLLKGKVMSGRYAGLRTYALYLELQNHLSTFANEIEYSDGIGKQKQPAVVLLAWQNASLYIEYQHGIFIYSLRNESGETLDLDVSQTEDLAKLKSIADSVLTIAN
ncbi:DUF262 domain-containing protein [Vibrio hippocampi]|uniref:GmrSD restriction endonucleases N-terminal domain-containing protein n=1 Tax=Vibrio hippocampi TaxID=654686 RepID=A0ABN8DMI5_9VIBR|nr:DUF262 domain-containing protein [Vibrio hippocampi]CAH0529890.1 hypothetical protein VHP8226_03646 [Vibrio hippocampi]